MTKRLLAGFGIASILVLGLPAAAFAAPQTIVDTPPAPMAVDSSSINRYLDVTASGVVTNATISVEYLASSDQSCTPPDNAEPSYPNELSLVLVSPSGAEATLVSAWTYEWDSPARRVLVAFDDSASDLVGTTNSRVPESGTFRPMTPLAAFNGEAAAGTWKLKFADAGYQDVSCYFGSSLTIESALTSETALSASTTTGRIGDPVILTAAVTGGSTVPGGLVEFFGDEVLLGTVPVDADGTAAFPATFTATGDHSVTAVYSGDGDFQGSTSAAQVVSISQRLSAVALSASHTAVNVGAEVSFSATVDPTATGDVQFLNGTTLLGAAPILEGTATATFAFPAAGSQSITAVYSGDAAFEGSTSVPVVVTVATPAVTPAASKTPAKAAPLAATGTGSTSGPLLLALVLGAAGLLTVFGARRTRLTQDS